MHEAAVIGDAEMCELLCEKGANVQERAWMVQYSLCRLVSRVLEDSPTLVACVYVFRVQARDTPLHYAACADHTPIIVMLCLFGANPDATNKVCSCGPSWVSVAVLHLIYTHTPTPAVWTSGAAFLSQRGRC